MGLRVRTASHLDFTGFQAFVDDAAGMWSAPTFEELYLPFPDRSDRPAIELVQPRAIPEPYRALLDHRRHMTVTVEEFYGEPVDVDVLQACASDDIYARKIRLCLRSGRAVQFAVARVDLGAVAPAVRAEILGERVPLGRILIQHGVMRTVEPVAFYRTRPTAALAGWLGLHAERTLFGRLGVLTVDGSPAIAVAEILAPVA